MWIARFSAVVICLFQVLALSHFAAADEKHVALIIGNGLYEAKPLILARPTSDSQLIASMLRTDANFDVFHFKNLGIVEFKRVIRDFEDRAAKADVAIVFYAGHGIEFKGTNYLLPTDARQRKDDLVDEGIPLDRIIAAVKGAKQMRLIILDACRDYPFKEELATRNAPPVGLSAVSDPGNVLIAFAAQAGAVAFDGTGENSPYTEALYKYLKIPGIDIKEALGRVRDEVWKSTDNKQNPAVYGSFGSTKFSIVSAVTTPTAPAPPKQDMKNCDRAEKHWTFTFGEYSKSTDVAKKIKLLEAHLANFSNCEYAENANILLQDLKTQKTVAATNSPPAPNPAASAASPAAAPNPTASSTAAAPSVDPAEQAWEKVQNSTKLAEVEEFIRTYGTSKYGAAATALQNKLKVQLANAAPISVRGSWAFKATCKDKSEWKGDFKFEPHPDGTLTGSASWVGGSGGGSFAGRVTGNILTFNLWDGSYKFALQPGGATMYGTETSSSHGQCNYALWR